MAEGIMADIWRDFWKRETGTGQQVALLHDRYTMMMMINWERMIEMRNGLKYLVHDIGKEEKTWKT